MRMKKGGDGRFQIETANFAANPAGGVTRGGGGIAQSTQQLLGADPKDTMLDGIIEERNPRQIQGMYRDIYMHDPVCGGAVDLRATMPWSDFSLRGGKDRQLDVFEDNINRLNMRTLHPELSVDQMVTGAFVASMIYRQEVKGFTDLIPFNYADCQITSTPLYSAEPIIRLEIGPELKDFVRDKGTEALDIKRRIPESILRQLRDNKVLDLKPLSTLYVPRTSMSSIQSGVSYFRRVLPIYLLERVLYRGTISEATRRQRAMLHVQAGDDEWIPDINELQDLVALFQSTESDPISAVVATRQNVIPQEIRAGGDFWKWTDNVDQLAALKMRALGINETFLSGEASYNTMETALTVFLEDLRAYRSKTTNQIYTTKLFPILAQIHGFRLEDRTDGRRRGLTAETAAYLQDFTEKVNDSAKLFIPEVQWHKQLGQEVDTNYIDVLDKLAEKNVPVTLRMWAAAGGIDLDRTVEELDADQKMRAKIKELTGAGGNNPFGQNDNDGGFGDDEAQYASLLSPTARFLSRDFGETGTIFERTVTGKKRHVPRQRIAQASMNDLVHKAIQAIRDPNVYREAYSRKDAWVKTLEPPRGA